MEVLGRNMPYLFLPSWLPVRRSRPVQVHYIQQNAVFCVLESFLYSCFKFSIWNVRIVVVKVTFIKFIISFILGRLTICVRNHNHHHQPSPTYWEHSNIQNKCIMYFCPTAKDLIKEIFLHGFLNLPMMVSHLYLKEIGIRNTNT